MFLKFKFLIRSFLFSAKKGVGFKELFKCLIDKASSEAEGENRFEGGLGRVTALLNSKAPIHGRD